MIKRLVFLFIIIGVINGCSKDDLCTEDTPVTPLLIVTFKNFDNQLFSKSVENLTVTTIVENQHVDILKYNTTDSIAIPLDTNFDFTDYLFIENDQEEIAGNTDNVAFNYNREDIYINSACAFKAIFKQLSALRENDDDNWIKEIRVNKFIVENENETHIIIFH